MVHPGVARPAAEEPHTEVETSTAWRTTCRVCDGLGHDDDILCPMPCHACNGTGLEDDDDSYPKWDADLDG